MKRTIDDAADRLRRALDRSMAGLGRPRGTEVPDEDDAVRRAFLEPDADLVPVVGSPRRATMPRVPGPVPDVEPAPARQDAARSAEGAERTEASSPVGTATRPPLGERAWVPPDGGAGSPPPTSDPTTAAASPPVAGQAVPRSVGATTDDFLDGLRRRVERRP